MLRNLFSATEIDVMLFLYKSPKKTQDICDYLGTSSTNVYVIASRMDKKGILKSVSDKSVLYEKAHYRLTELGHAVCEEVKSLLKPLRIKKTQK